MRRARSLLLVVFCAANLCAAQRTFVSSANGNDANPCSRSLPCRNFAAALPQTDPDGEVIVLDSGGYGAVIITQPVSLISPSGVHAGITAFSGNAVTVDAGNTAHVVLRNLSLNSQGALTGIDALNTTVGTLYLENCVVSGFAFGIGFQPTSSGARLYVSDTVVRRSDVGVYVSGTNVGGASIRASIDSVKLYQNAYGVEVYVAQATIRDSEASGGGHSGFFAAQGAKVMVEHSLSTTNSEGFFAADPGTVMILTRCAASSNTYGVAGQALPGTTIYVSDSTVTANGTGIQSGVVIISRGNNTLEANTTNGSFTNTFPSN